MRARETVPGLIAGLAVLLQSILTSSGGRARLQRVEEQMETKRVEAIDIDQSFKCLITSKNGVTIQQVPSVSDRRWGC